MQSKVHLGRNIKRLREMMGIKQEAFAMELGHDWNQKKISLLEAKEEVEPALLDQVASVLHVPVEAIRNFDDQQALNIVSNTFNEAAIINSAGTFNINPLEKWLEALNENRKLYERLLQSEREKVDLLQQLLDKK